MLASSPTSETRPFPGQSPSNKEKWTLEIFVLHCGQGDTILLRLLGEKWVLIDCNLPKGLAQKEFFSLIDKLGVQRLDLICLTHPHDDHYTGMEAVLHHFSSNGRSVGTFCDCGTEPKEIHTLLARKNRPNSSVREYERLYQYLYSMFESGQIQYFRADENSEPILVSKEIKLMAVGPRPVVSKLANQKALASGKIRFELNHLSIVLALIVRTEKGQFDGLLAADTDANGFRAAMEKLQSRIPGKSNPSFDFIKVSHHGSLDSHANSNVCKHKKEDKKAVAAISTGCFDVLPDREVI